MKPHTLSPIASFFAILICIFIPYSAKTQDVTNYNLSCQLMDSTLTVTAEVDWAESVRAHPYFLLSEFITIDQLSVNGNPAVYHRNGDTVAIQNATICKCLNLRYRIPLNLFTTSDAIVLRRENRWYPCLYDNLVKAKIDFNAKKYYIVSNAGTPDCSYELHLFLLPKNQYDTTLINGENRQFCFYRNRINPAEHSPSFYHEFIISYQFYAQLFRDQLSSSTFHIVEIYDNDFQLCQSLKDAIIFGHLFYNIYEMMPQSSWVPHEVAHQWWGNALFFKKMDLFWAESVTEYLKVQYIKKDKMAYYDMLTLMRDNIKKIKPKKSIREIDGLSDPNSVRMIYHLAPYLMETSTISVNGAFAQNLAEIFSKNKNHLIDSNDCYFLLDNDTQGKIDHILDAKKLKKRVH